MPFMKMADYGTDPKEDLLNAIGDLEDFVVMNDRVLVATYKRPSMTATGIHLPDQHIEEDKYQGKVGLIVKLGPLAFRDDKPKGIEFPIKLSVGDWIVLRVSDGWPLSVKGFDCRMVRDTDVKLKIAQPDSVF